MNLQSASLYRYLFFYIDPVHKTRARDMLEGFFAKQHSKDYTSPVHPLPANESGCEGKYCRSGDLETGGKSMGMLIYHDMAIVEFQWLQHIVTEFGPETRNLPDLSSNFDDLLSGAPPHFYLGSTWLYLAVSAGRTAREKQELGGHLGLSLTTEEMLFEMPNCGRLYLLNAQKDEKYYLLVTESEKFQPAIQFADMDFPFLEGFIRKIQHQDEESRKVIAQKERYEQEFKRSLAEDQASLSAEKFSQLKNWFLEFQTRQDWLLKSQRTIQINGRNAQNILAQLQPVHDTLFTPFLATARHLVKQLGNETFYLKITLNGFDRHLRFLEAQINRERLDREKRAEQRQEERERQIERLIAAIGVGIGIGQLVANVQFLNEEAGAWNPLFNWLLRAALVFLSGWGVFSIMPRLFARGREKAQQPASIASDDNP